MPDLPSQSIVLISVLAVALLSTGVGLGLTHYNVIDLREDTDSNSVQSQSNTIFTTQQNVVTQNNSEFIERVTNSTVSVYITDGNGRMNSVGSGFQYTDEHIITNQHVIAGAEEVYVKYVEGEWSKAEVVGSDVHTDVAVLRPDLTYEEAEPLPVQTNLPDRGETVLAIGSPNGRHDSISSGIVSGLNRSVRIGTPFAVPDSIQIDAALNPGNSGGPLLDPDEAAVLGINRATSGENIGYAVSGRIMDKVAQSIIETGDKSQPYIGISTVEANPISLNRYDVESDSGLIVAEVFPDTPADGKFESDVNGTADVITAIDGTPIRTNEELSSYLIRKTEPNDVIEFTVNRDGTEETVELKLGARSEYQNPE